MPDDVFHQYFHHVNLPQWTVGGQAGLLGLTVMSGISNFNEKVQKLKSWVNEILHNASYQVLLNSDQVWKRKPAPPACLQQPTTQV